MGHPSSIDAVVDDLIRRRGARPVLLAEDDPEMRALLAAPLREDGCDLIEAANGVELVRAVHRFEAAGVPLRLVITDLRMPGLDGLDVLAYLRCAGFAVPVIVMTAFGNAQVHDDAAAGGAALVLDKPFDVDDLRAAVAQIGPAARY